MSKSIDLIRFGKEKVASHWPLGQILDCDFNLQAVYKLIETRLPSSFAEAFLFWEGALGQPDMDRLQELLKQPVDLWHAGLKLGMGGLPGAIDFVQPTWMLNRDPDPEIEATSWRVSFRACLIRTEVLRQMGGIRPEFKTLEAAALEMGHRFISRGVLMRHVPGLLPISHSRDSMSSPNDFIGDQQADSRLKACGNDNKDIPFEDELRFVYYRFGKKWAQWTLMRAVLSGYVSFAKAFAAWKKVCFTNQNVIANPARFLRGAAIHEIASSSPLGTPHNDRPPVSISVLIPTLERYPYLRLLLEQLRGQTVKPLEIIIVDQTPIGQREPKLADEFKDLPLKIVYLDQPGQCSSRNAGLKIAVGERVLFLDDDVEIPPNFIQKHLQTLRDFSCEVSSGVINEIGTSGIPENFKCFRTSDVFPAGNSMIQKDILKKSGLFDFAYNHKQRADADLGMRIYLGGAQMILNPEISVLHHHASQGGLRAHKARVVTYASSRKSLFQRHLPSDSEIYLAMRYFTPRQIRESLWLRILGTFSARGAKGMRILKFIISLASLPNTLWEIRQASIHAKHMLQVFSAIPNLENLIKPLPKNR